MVQCHSAQKMFHKSVTKEFGSIKAVLGDSNFSLVLFLVPLSPMNTPKRNNFVMIYSLQQQQTILILSIIMYVGSPYRCIDGAQFYNYRA